MKTFFSTNVLRCTTQLTKEFEIAFYALLLGSGTQEVRFERVSAG